jgi:hypothetical protein
MNTNSKHDPTPVASSGSTQSFFSAVNATEALGVDDAAMTTGVITTAPTESPMQQAQHIKNRRRIIRYGILALVLIIGSGLVLYTRHTASTRAASTQTDASQQYGTLTIPLTDISNTASSLNLQGGRSLSINGQLNVTNSLVLAPTNQPTNGVAGQLYYDKTGNQLSYFNGTKFLTVLSSDGTDTSSVSSLGGVSGAIGTGSGIDLTDNVLSNSGVLTLQGQTGDISLVSGDGIAIDGTTLSNSGVLSLGGQNGEILLGNGLSLSGNTLNAAQSNINSVTGTGNVSVTNDGNGNLTIGTTGQPGLGTVTSPGGTIGKFAVFDGVQDIADSLLSQTGGTVTVSGALSVTGALNLSAPLAVTSGGTGATTAANARTNLLAAKSGANSDITSLSGLTTALSVVQGGTGTASLTANSILMGNGTGAITAITAGSTGQCLVSTAGAPAFTTCPGSGGVVSLDGLTSAIAISNTSGSGTTITIDNASTIAKGIASFNSTNFTVTSGAVNTIQNIATTASPTFASINLTSALSIANGGTGAITAPLARTNLSAAKSGANSDITALSGLTTALSVIQGGTGTTSVTANGVLIGNGTGAFTSVTGTTGQCLLATTGSAPSFGTCPGSGGVSSVNSLTGALTVQGVSAGSVSSSVSTITINDASTSTKGLASFNSTNFSVTGGAVNTIQDIATSAAPTFGQLSLTSSQASNPMLVVNNTNVAAAGNLLDLKLNGSSKLSVAPSGNLTTVGTITSGLINGQTISNSANFTGSVAVTTTLSVNTITPTGALTVGAAGQSFTLQGNASSKLTATNGGNTTSVAFQSPTASVTYNFATAAAGTYDVCTTVGNCNGSGGVTSTGGTTNKIAKFTAGQAIGDSIISDNGTTVTIAGALAVNTITPSTALTVGATGQNLTLQGATVSLSSTSGGITNNLTFATPSGSNKTITVPNASGTVAVSASGPLSLDSSGNLTCATCLSSGGGGAGGVTSINTATGTLTLQGSSAGSVTLSGTTLTIVDATSSTKGLASFNSTNLTVTSGAVNTVQDIAVTSTPTFAGLSLTAALSVTNGGTGAITAPLARTNLGAAASGANSDITSLSGLTTALSVAQGGTGIVTTPTNGQLLIGNGSGYSLNTLSAGTGITINNTAGGITISSTGAGTCASCANTSLNNLASVAINTSLLPGTAGGANLGSSTLPFGQLSLAGTSSSPATNNFLITGASTSGTRTITLPNASGTVGVSGSGYIALNSSTGNISFTGTLAVADGGTGAITAPLARTNLGAAASGANSDITSLSGLTTALSVIQGGTGANTLTANGILMGNGTGAITAIAAVGSGQCLVSTAGAPVFTTCPGGGSVGTIGTIDTQTPSADGAVISGSSIYLQSASASNPGLVNTSTQIFAGAKTFNGSITLGASAGSGTVFTNNGATVNSTLALGNFTSGGSIGTAGTTVDIYTSISVAQTTTSQTLTLPTPTASTVYGRTLYLSNIGSTSFTVLSTPLKAGATATFVWSNTNGGASWQYAGADGNSILNQSAAAQSANFFIQGAASTVAAVVQGAAGQDIADFKASGGSTVAYVDASGNIGTSGTYYAQGTFNTNHDFYVSNATNNNTTATTSTLNSYVANLTGGANSNAGANILNGVRFNDVTPVTNNVFNGLSFGTGYTSLLTYNGNQLISGTGVLQSAAVSGTYSNGLTLSNTANVYTGASATLGGSSSLTLGTASSASGSIKFNSSAGTGSVTLSLNNPGSNNFTLSIPTLTANDTLCTVGSNNCSGSGVASIGTIDSQTANANGAVISGTALYLQSASVSNPGLVNTSTQSFAGAKTFTGATAVAVTSTTAFQIQNTGGSTTLLSADTTNGRISIGSLGTAQGQLYVSGALPSAAVGSATTGLSGPRAIATQGNYVYIVNAVSGTLVVYDESNPASPVKLGSTTTDLAQPTSIVVQGHYAYVTDFFNQILVVFDISNPNSPTAMGFSATGLTAGPISVAVSGQYAYVTTYNGGSSLVTFDISNPASPVRTGTTATGLSNASYVAVQGRYAYVASRGNSSLVTFDLAVPGVPVKVGSISTGLNAPTSVAVQGRYAYIVDNGNDTLTSFDVSNPASPASAGSVSLGASSGGTNIYIQGHYAYVTLNSSAKVGVYNITNPASMSAVGTFNTGTGPYDINVQGRYAYVAAYNANSISAFDLGGAYIQQLEAGGISTGSLNVSNNASIGGTLSVNSGLTVGQSATINASLNVAQSITGSGGITISGGAINLQGNAASTITTANAATSASISIQTGNSTAGTAASVSIDTGTSSSGTSVINVGTINAGSVAIGKSGSTTTVNGNLTIGSSGGIATTFINYGASLIRTSVFGGLTLNGPVGAAAFTVDLYTSMAYSQTTPGIALTLPSPTVTTAGKLMYISDAGSVNFTMNGVIISPSSPAVFLWSGSAWTLVGSGSANTIVNGTTQQVGANFNIDGTGTAGTLQAASLDTASAGTLTVGNTNATTINVGSNNAGHTINIGNGTGTQVVSVGSFSSSSTTLIAGGSSGSVTVYTGGGGTVNIGDVTNAVNQVVNVGASAIAGSSNTVTVGSAIGGSPTVLQAGTSGLSIRTGNNAGGIAGAITIDTGTSSSGISLLNIGTSNAGTITIGRTNATTNFAGNISALGIVATPNAANYATTGVTNNLPLTVGSYYRLTGASTQTITGFANGIDGRLITITNAASQAAVIKNNDTTDSSAANVIITGTGADVSLPAGATMTFIYDGSGAVWRVVGGVATTGAGVSSIGTIDTQTASANGAVISGSALYLQSASATNPGLVNASAQIFAGAKTFNGSVTLGASAGSGTVLTNNGATVNSTLALTNFSSGGSIGTAAATVDLYTAISVAQTSSSQTLTLPNPTASTAYGRMLYLSNIGTASFTVLSTPLKAGATASFVWSNTNGGASWQYAGADGNSILNQSSSTQTADFLISGTGTANTFQASTFGSSNSVTLQASSGNDVTISPGAGGGGSGILNLAVNAATLNIGNNSNNARTISIGSTAGTAAQTITVGNNSGTTSTTTIQGSGGVLLQANGAAVGVAVKSATNSTLAFQVQNASSVSLFTVDTSTSTITLGTGGNAMTLTAGTFEPILSGTARHIKTIKLEPEYAGAVLDALSDSTCSSANSGTLTSGYDFTNDKTYYAWTSPSATAQCYDIVTHVVLPSDFAGWNSGSGTVFTLGAETTDTTNGTVSIQIRDTANSSAYAYTAQTIGSANTWTFVHPVGWTGGTFNADDTMTVRIRVSAKNGAQVNVGALALTYYSKY